MYSRAVSFAVALLVTVCVFAEEKATEKDPAGAKKSTNFETKLSYHISNSSEKVIETRVSFVKKKGNKVTNTGLLKCKPYSDVRGVEPIFFNSTTGPGANGENLIVRVFNGNGDQIGTATYNLAPGSGGQLPTSGFIDTDFQYLDIAVYGGSNGYTVYFLPIRKP